MLKIRRLLIILLTMLLLVSNCTIYASEQSTYIVKKDDVLWEIADKLNISFKELADINNISNPNLIFPGQVLKYTQRDLKSDIPKAIYNVEEKIVNIDRNGLKMVGTLTYPEGVKKAPAIVIFHGFTGQRNEMGIAGTNETMFMRTARVFSEQGYATLRIDFIGSGESDGKWEDTTVSNQINDAEAAIKYLKGLDNIDEHRIGLLGLSQGGMVAACTAGRNEDVKAAILWSPASIPQYVYGNLLGHDALLKGVQSKDEEEVITGKLPWGGTTQLKAKFFKDIFALSPSAEITSFQGALQVVVGLKDTVVYPQPYAGQVYIDYHNTNTAPEEMIILDDADHMLNIFVNNEALDKAIISGLRFLEKNL